MRFREGRDDGAVRTSFHFDPDDDDDEYDIVSRGRFPCVFFFEQRVVVVYGISSPTELLLRSRRTPAVCCLLFLLFPPPRAFLFRFSVSSAFATVRALGFLLGALVCLFGHDALA